MKGEIAKIEVIDWPELLVIFDKSLRSIAEQDKAYTPEEWISLYQCLMNHSFFKYDVYKYVEDGKILGFVCYFQHKIEMLYVLPEHMNRGIGSHLIKFILENYKEPLEIGVSKVYPVSRHIYEKFGFVIYADKDYDVSGIYSPHYLMKREYKE